MNRGEAAAALQRALEISRELTAVADGGDIRLTLSLDAERLQLLKCARAGLQPVDLGLSVTRWRQEDLDALVDKLVIGGGAFPAGGGTTSNSGGGK